MLIKMTITWKEVEKPSMKINKWEVRRMVDLAIMANPELRKHIKCPDICNFNPIIFIFDPLNYEHDNTDYIIQRIIKYMFNIPKDANMLKNNFPYTVTVTRLTITESEEYYKE